MWLTYDNHKSFYEIIRQSTNIQSISKYMQDTDKMSGENQQCPLPYQIKIFLYNTVLTCIPLFINQNQKPPISNWCYNKPRFLVVQVLQLFSNVTWGQYGEVPAPRTEAQNDILKHWTNDHIPNFHFSLLIFQLVTVIRIVNSCNIYIVTFVFSQNEILLQNLKCRRQEV